VCIFIYLIIISSSSQGEKFNIPSLKQDNKDVRIQIQASVQRELVDLEVMEENVDQNPI
jgi:hypothetical protein